ncbi:hypothetical protein VMT65_15510 [Nocardia sp. CDC153]|uniref:hypothetical protein n=1 Tax=Nocardia sp. CDC153 TaxID=3112167 RepID=UPI002DB7440C|nr:hypothetical protein [Nocardia sp. CDC153]MEC3954448.1 hypothetical protein [Nocardia sp. CDC153]
MTASDKPCTHCGWPTTQPFQVLSCHHTSEGLVTYTRCACGALGIHLTPAFTRGRIH